MSEFANSYVNAIGALCETCGLMLKQLKAQGFTRSEALHLVEVYVKTTFQPKQNKEEN